MKQIFSIIGRTILIGLLLTSSAVFGNQAREQILDKGGFAPELVTREESTVIEHALEHMLMRMAEHNEEPTESLLRLYQAVTEKTEIKIEDLNELLPVMLECMKAEQERAARPDAADALGNGAISGCCGCCDLSQILAVLGSIQAKLVIINNLIVECCDEIRLDFQATWSILANLNVTATVDLNPVFSVITDCCNGTFTAINSVNNNVIATFSTLNQIIINQQGTFSTIEACCDGTFSAIADLKLSLTAIQVNLNPVFTALAACCNSTFSMLDKIDREVISTFSILNTIIINEQGTFTAIAACCNGTFSTLANLSVTATVDLSGVFSVLANLTVTATADLSGAFSALSACCNGTFSSINSGFQQTWTILNSLRVTASVDLSPVFSVINAGFNGTFSSLAACCNGTFSALNQINNNIVGTFSVLNRILIDDQGTFSALAACCNGTFSTLANLRVTASVDLSGVFTALAACCNGTFSSLANLRVTASVDLSGIFTTLADIETTLTACGAIPIFTATQITATGNYCLAKDIVGTITILSNEVSLDLNNRKITSSPLSSAILIDNVKDVIVKNGVVTLGGVFVQSSSVVTIDNIFSLNSVVASFSVVNSNTVEIINCQSSLNSAGNVCFARTVSGLTINNLNVDNGTVANGLFLTDINNLFVDKIAITAFSFNNDCINLASCCCVSISNISATKSNFQGSGTAIRGTSCSIVKIDGGEFAGNTLVSTSSRLITFSSCKDVNLNGIDISSNNFSNGFFSLIEHNDGIGDSSITNCNINANSLNGINRVASNFIFVGNTPCLIDGNNISSNTTSNTNRVNNFIRASGPELCIIDNIIDANSLNFSCTFINITGTGAALVEDSVISNNLISASLAGNSFTGIVSTASAIIRNTTIEGNVLVSGVAQDISSCISILGNYGIIEGATILSNQFGSNSISLGVSVTGSNSIVRGCSLIGNTFNGFIAKCISSTSTFGLIENNILVGNTSDVASSMDVISNTGSLSTIRNCLVSGNSVTTFGGIITGIRDTGSMNVIDSNKIVNNSGTVSSTGLNSNAGAFGNMIISNESKSHTNNYVIGTGAIPLVTISLSTALTTAITAGTVTCFHNVSTVA